ncbi:hypothetical protein LDENG_00228960, partial [Lucifuga dentata]
VLLERKETEDHQESDRKDSKDQPACQVKAGQDLQALQALPELEVPPDVQATPASAGPPDPPATATPLSVSAFPTTDKDMEVHSNFLCRLCCFH